ncbi:hypothetical protein ACNKHM_13885 [Shigella sonnei]
MQDNFVADEEVMIIAGCLTIIADGRLKCFELVGKVCFVHAGEGGARSQIPSVKIHILYGIWADKRSASGFSL